MYVTRQICYIKHQTRGHRSMFPGGENVVTSNDDISSNKQPNTPSVLTGESLKGSKTNIDEDLKVNDSQELSSALTANGSKSRLFLLLKNVKKMTQFGMHSSGISSKNRSNTLGRSKSLKRGILQTTGPLCSVSIGKQVYFEGNNVPGVVGIKNHGNTCYMNSVLQCLSNTELLVQYFVSDQYKQDMKGKTKQNAKKFGTKGEVTTHLARLLKSLWSQHYSPSISSDLKAVVGKYGSQYRGTLQHDAQEFLLWLLDKVHEDLNIASKKKHKNTKTITGRSDELAAAEALANHTRSNNSYVHDLFQALYKSSLTCPKCRQQSNTFDPFLCVSLPIPQRNSKPLYVTVVYFDAHPKQVRLGLLLEPSDSVKQLREALSCDTNIPQEQLILTEIYYDGFHRTFHDHQPLTELREADNIYAIEVPAASAPEEAIEESTGSPGIMLLFLNKPVASAGRRFGGPFILSVHREISHFQLQQEILGAMAPMLKDGIIDQAKESKELLFGLKVLEDLVEKSQKCLLPADVELPLFMPEVERALQACIPGGGPEHVKMIIEWKDEVKHRVFGDTAEHVEEHASVKQVKTQNQRPLTASLVQCLTTYTQEERLESDNAWHCPNCHSQQYGTTKAISLWSLPDVFIIHLKRFKQLGTHRSKLETLITFPLTNLDMSKHIAKRPPASQNVNKDTNWSPWRPNRKSPTTEADYTYDLYGVVNHYGNMQGGHYTAFCKSAATSKWYTFDDIKVTEMNENDVISHSAYLLFYQRRSANSCTIYHPDHWLHKVTRIRFTDPPTRHSQSQEDLLEDSKSSNAMVRNTNPYATMRSPHKATHNAVTPKIDTSSFMVGSPSMGSLGHVQISSDPGRQVRADSVESNPSSPRIEHNRSDLQSGDHSHVGHVRQVKQKSLERSRSDENLPNGDVPTGILIDLDSTVQEKEPSEDQRKKVVTTKRRRKKTHPNGPSYAGDGKAHYTDSHSMDGLNEVLLSQNHVCGPEGPGNGMHSLPSAGYMESNIAQNDYSRRLRNDSLSSYHSTGSSSQRSQNNLHHTENQYSHDGSRMRNNSQGSHHSYHSYSSRSRKDSQNSGMFSPQRVPANEHHIPPLIHDLGSIPYENGYPAQRFDVENSGHNGTVPRQIQYPPNPQPYYSPQQKRHYPVGSPKKHHQGHGVHLNSYEDPHHHHPHHHHHHRQNQHPEHYQHGISPAASTTGSSYDNVSVENNLNDQRLASILANTSLQHTETSTPKTRVKRPQPHASALPKEIKSPGDRFVKKSPRSNRKKDTPEKESNSLDNKPIYLQESCV